MAKCKHTGCGNEGKYADGWCFVHLPANIAMALRDEQLNRGCAMKFGEDKPRLSLIPFPALLEVAKVYSYGAKKYSPWNWLKGIQFSTYLDSAKRHIGAFECGEDRDPDTGDQCHHLAQAIFGLMAIIVFQLMGRKDLDDRPNYKEICKPPAMTAEEVQRNLEKGINDAVKRPQTTDSEA